MTPDRRRPPGPMPGTPILDEDARLMAYLDTGILPGRRKDAEAPPGRRPARGLGIGVLWGLIAR